MTRRVEAGLAATLLLLAGSANAVDPNFRLHADEFPLVPLTRLVVGVNAGSIPVSSLTSSPSYPNMAALEAGTVWDFRGLTGPGRALQAAPVATGWSCYVPEAGLTIENRPCGFDLPENDLLFVQDAWDTGARDVLAIDYDDAGTFWLRAWAIDEGNTPSVGDEELRLCFRPEGNRKAVPFIKFNNTDGGRFFMAAGDPSWQSDLFDCDGGIFANNVVVATQGAPCGSGGGTNAALTNDSSTLGRFRGRVAGAGTMTLPSGHQLDSILVEILASFEAKLVVFCLGADAVTRQYQLMWLVPGYGPIVQVRSAGDQGPDLTTWTEVPSTVVANGLLPPLSIQVDSVVGTSVTVSWDPGLVPDVADGFEVHWGTQPGAAVAPPFASGFLPAAAGMSYVINGLDPDTDYWISVTSLADYTDPRSGVTTTYRSIALPQSIGADVDGDGVQDTSYPPEVMARTGVAAPAEACCLPGGVCDDLDPAACAASGGSAQGVGTACATTTCAGGSLAVNRATMLGARGATPPVGDAFDAGCATPPHRLCAEEIVPGDLGSLRLQPEGAPTGVPSLRCYEHSDSSATMKVSRADDILFFWPS